MTNMDQIKNIDELIRLDAGKKIIRHKVQRLTGPGENYGSLMLSVDIIAESPDGTEEIKAVAKMVPPNEFIQEIFNTPVTFRNEIAFYKNIVPLLQNFQREHGVEKVIEFAPKYYGSRLNLTGDKTTIDSDGALVLENLKAQNYVVPERTEGLDLDVAKLIISNLAHLHAVSLALKIQKPDVFESEIKPYLAPMVPTEHNFRTFKKQITNIIEQRAELLPLKKRILEGYAAQMVPHEPREPFATFVHNDCWINNNLVQFESAKSKLVDYQICSYGSPARDLVFFLFSSVKNHVVEKNYNYLLQWYHETLTSVLEELNCDVSPFIFEALEEEMDFEANSQFGHVAFMLSPIFIAKKDLKDVLDLGPHNLIPLDATDLHQDKFVFVVNEFVKRNWI